MPCWLLLCPHCIKKGSWGQKGGDKAGIRKEKKLEEEFESPHVKHMNKDEILQCFSFQKAVFRTLPASSQS